MTKLMRSQTKKQLGRWGLLSFLIVLSVSILYAAVSLPPASGQAAAADAELLTKQIEFILKMNSAFLGFLGIVGALLTWFFKNNLDDAREVASDMVRRELDSRVKALVKDEFEYWERTVLPERIVGNTLVDYFLPNAAVEKEEISEIPLLEIRGFRKPVRFCTTERKLRSRRGDITILDLQNMVMSSGQRFTKLPGAEQETHAKDLVERLLDEVLADPTVLVVYFRGYINNLNRIEPKSKTQYLLIANNPVTLVGHAANGAYVVYGDRHSAS
ncbi:MAG: hypothetical protein AAGF01_11925 [Cyanobacteria bacterium P01_G01_bin.38]